MTKKHFTALADALIAERPLVHDERQEHAQWRLDVYAIASVCAAFNPRFNRGRWLDYVNGLCGPNGGKRNQTVRTEVKL